MEQDILKVIKYFSNFSYPPTLNDIYMFLPHKTLFKKLRKKVEEMTAEGKLKSKKIKKESRYTIPRYSIFLSKYLNRMLYSKKKIEKIKNYLRSLSFIPQIKLVGLSGSLTMMNANKNDDIDIFIVTQKNRLWTGRLLAVIMAEIFGIRRRRGENKAADKICLNLFFDEGSLKVPKIKETVYVAHEILQMKPLIIKDRVYEKFIKANSWIFDIFPNAFDVVRDSKKVQCSAFSVQRLQIKLNLPGFKQIGDFFERIFKNLQKYYIRRHQTTEFISQKQLWFFPEDFEKKLKD